MRRAIFFILLFYAVTTNGQFVKQQGQLSVSGTQLVNSKGEPVVLRGMSFGWSCFHPRFYTEGAVHTLVKDWKCNVIRAALGVEPKNGYKQDSATQIKLIQTVVDAAIKEDVYVIIDWHSHNINLEEAKRFFKTMAYDYGNYPNIIYEVFNEPDHESWAEVKAYAAEIIKVIREEDTDNIILIGSPRWDQEVQLPAADPIKGYKNLMYTMHFYAGTHKQWLRDRTDEAIKNGLPIFVSECAGMEATGNGPIDDAEWKKFIEWMEERKISWLTWSVSDKDETCSVLNPSASSDGNWNDADLKESGIKIKNYLKHYNQ
ncbi:MAG: glycoside hydrolase family 5 protein [Sphingobacteriales bacterium]|nr:glycoside hydrolase family 5 protein [Sphingobacteriales bacterium]MBI3717610.1 glycoside hydrolase family 5 protein [Sphingobacteriales bacterium]